MTADVQNLLATADRSWEAGLLQKAHATYLEVLARDPSNWHASFQLAWVDSAFGPIDADRVDALRKRELPATAMERLDRLAERFQRGPFLEGGIAEWDLNALRKAPGEKTARWWEDHGALATSAGQYGLALACYGEAEVLEPEMYFDPPASFKAVLKHGNHLKGVRSAD